MSSDGVYLACCPSRHCAVYFLIGTPDLLNDAQVQVVVRRDPADAAFAVDAQQGAVLGPLVAGRCVELLSSTRRRDRRTSRYSSSFLLLCHRRGSPRRRLNSSMQSSLAPIRTSAVAPYCNLAKFGLGLLSPDLERPLSTCRHGLVVSIVGPQCDWGKRRDMTGVEFVAPASAVMLSECTTRGIEHASCLLSVQSSL